MPLSVNMNMVLSAYMIPSPLPGAGRTDNDCEAESDIPFVTQAQRLHLSQGQLARRFSLEALYYSRKLYS